MLMFSDHDYGPDVVRLKRSPEVFKEHGTWALNNAVFFTALGFCFMKDIDFMLYVEMDCRVGRDNWDREVFEEALTQPNYEDAIAFGSVIFHSPCNYDARFTKLWADYMAQWNKARKNFPVPTFGAGGSAEKREPNVFVNGALGIYNVKKLKEMFPQPFQPGMLATQCTAWDFEIGKRSWVRHKHDTVDKFRLLGSVYSTYGNAVTTEEDRKDMLLSNEFVAVHQIESDWEGPQVEAKVTHSVAKREILTPGRLAIVIVSYAGAFEWLKWCMASIREFSDGIYVHVAVPYKDFDAFRNSDAFKPAVISGFDEAAGIGHLEQMRMKCWAPEWPDMPEDITHFVHIDSDCVFTAKVNWDKDYFIDDLPILLKEAYANLHNHPRMAWKQIVQNTLGFQTPFETMCRHPSIYPRWLYAEVRSHIEKVHGKPFDKYMRSCKPAFPYGFCEFNTLGGYAMKFHAEHFHWVEVIGVDGGEPAVNIDHKGYPYNPLKQFWGHQPLGNPDKTGQLERMGHGNMTVQSYFTDVLKLKVP